MLDFLPKTIEYLKGTLLITKKLTEFTSLRYLCFSEGGAFRELPPYLVEIKSLEVLETIDWGGLGISHLPNDVDKMVNLRELLLRWSTLSFLPPKIGNLTLKKLRTGEVKYIPKTFKQPFPEDSRWFLHEDLEGYYDLPGRLVWLLEDWDEGNHRGEHYWVDVSTLEAILAMPDAHYYHQAATIDIDLAQEALAKQAPWMHQVTQVKNVFESIYPSLGEIDADLEVEIARYHQAYDETQTSVRYIPEYLPPEEAVGELAFDYNAFQEAKGLLWSFLEEYAGDFYPQLNHLDPEFDWYLNDERNAYVVFDTNYIEPDTIIPISKEVEGFLLDEAYGGVMNNVATTFEEVIFLNNCSELRFYVDNNLVAFAHEDDVWDELIDPSKQILAERSLIEEGLSFFIA